MGFGVGAAREVSLVEELTAREMLLEGLRSPPGHAPHGQRECNPVVQVSNARDRVRYQIQGRHPVHERGDRQEANEHRNPRVARHPHAKAPALRVRQGLDPTQHRAHERLSLCGETRVTEHHQDSEEPRDEEQRDHGRPPIRDATDDRLRRPDTTARREPLVALDAILAVVHHILAFGLLGTLAIEWALVRPGLTADSLARLRSVDRTYGLLAATLLTIGVSRLFLGAVGPGYYLTNLFFWAKMAAFGAVGLLSIGPTAAYIRWGRAALETDAWHPPAAEIEAARRAIVRQLALFPLIPTFAALMARGFGA